MLSLNDSSYRDEEIHLRILQVLNSRGAEWTQRELTNQLGVSLGKTNFCITELANNGFIYIQRFKNPSNKSAYAYSLTTEGIEEKFRLLVHFLSRKLPEYEI